MELQRRRSIFSNWIFYKSAWLIPILFVQEESNEEKHGKKGEYAKGHKASEQKGHEGHHGKEKQQSHQSSHGKKSGHKNQQQNHQTQKQKQ